MGLLVLAYIGSFLAGERRIRGLGLPSGAEYVGLGFLLGPSALGLLDRSSLELFDPLAQVALGWIALVLGLGFGVHRQRHTKPARVVLGALSSVVSAGVIAAPLWFAVTRWTLLRGEPRLLLVAATALACAETTRESVRWVTERYGAKGPLATAVSDLAQSDDIGPLLLLAVCFSVGVSVQLPWRMTVLSWAAATLGVGVVFGATAALLIGRELQKDETWGTLLGVSVLATGITARLGLSTLSATFAMGVALAVLSGHRQSLLAMVEPTERTVLHPVLLLAGARIDLRALASQSSTSAHAPPVLVLLVVTVLLGRTAAKWIVGLVWQVGSRPARAAGPALGLGLLSAGTLCMIVGLACALRFPGDVGDTVLVIAAASTTFGEIVGPFALRRALRSAGEIAPDAPTSEPREAATGATAATTEDA